MSMEFPEYWKDAWIEMDFPETAHDVERIVRDAFRAGLLHAAEQDREAGDEREFNNPNAGIFYISAAMHRQAAEKLK